MQYMHGDARDCRNERSTSAVAVDLGLAAITNDALITLTHISRRQTNTYKMIRTLTVNVQVCLHFDVHRSRGCPSRDHDQLQALLADDI